MVVGQEVMVVCDLVGCDAGGMLVLHDAMRCIGFPLDFI